MAKRTCYKLFKNLLKYIHCVPGLVSRRTKNRTQPPLVGGRRVVFLFEVSSGKIALSEPNIFQVVLLKHMMFDIVHVCPPLNTRVRIQKKKITQMFFCLFLTSLYPSFFHLLFFFWNLIGTYCPCYTPRIQICLSKAAWKVFCVFVQCKICPPSSASLLTLHYSSDFCLKVSLLDVQREVDTLFPLSVSHLQRVLCVWF